MPRYSQRTGQLMEYQTGPFDQAHLYLQWGGKLPGGEEWSCGMRLAKTGGGSVFAADATAGLPDCTTAVTTLHTSAGAKISNVAKLSFVKLNVIGTDGHYTYDATTEQVLADIAGGSGGEVPPNQVACAVTLETGFSRGPAHRGRFYLPVPTATTLGDGMIGAAEAGGIAAAVDTMLAEVALADGLSSFTPAVFSRKAGAPAHRAITDARCGRVLDTQRRRRRSLSENYVTS